VKIKQFFLGLIACVAIQGGVTAVADDNSTRIINGTSIDDTEDKFVALLMKEVGNTDFYTPYCAGTYVGNGLVVTAAHCTDSLSTAHRIYLSANRAPIGYINCNTGSQSL